MMALLSTLENSQAPEQQAQIIQQLQIEFNAVNELLARKTSSCIAVQSSEKNTQVLSLSEFKILCEQLRKDAENAELNDELLATLADNAPATYQSDVDALIEYFDQFDFDNAQSTLIALIELLNQAANLETH